MYLIVMILIMRMMRVMMRETKTTSHVVKEDVARVSFFSFLSAVSGTLRVVVLNK